MQTQAERERMNIYLSSTIRRLKSFLLCIAYPILFFLFLRWRAKAQIGWNRMILGCRPETQIDFVFPPQEIPKHRKCCQRREKTEKTWQIKNVSSIRNTCNLGLNSTPRFSARKPHMCRTNRTQINCKSRFVVFTRRTSLGVFNCDLIALWNCNFIDSLPIENVHSEMIGVGFLSSRFSLENRFFFRKFSNTFCTKKYSKHEIIYDFRIYNGNQWMIFREKKLHEYSLKSFIHPVAYSFSYSFLHPTVSYSMIEEVVL